MQVIYKPPDLAESMEMLPATLALKLLQQNGNEILK